MDPDAASLEFNLLDVPGFRAGRILRFRRTGSDEYYRLLKSSVGRETIRFRPSPLKRMDAFVDRERLVETMTHAVLQHIPLATAYLCQDCNAVGNCAMICPACASGVLLGLAGVLDREECRPEASWPRLSPLAA